MAAGAASWKWLSVSTCNTQCKSPDFGKWKVASAVPGWHLVQIQIHRSLTGCRPLAAQNQLAALIASNSSNRSLVADKSCSMCME